MTNIENKSVVEELEDELIIEEEDAKKTQSESKQSTLTKNEGD